MKTGQIWTYALLLPAVCAQTSSTTATPVVTMPSGMMGQTTTITAFLGAASGGFAATVYDADNCGITYALTCTDSAKCQQTESVTASQLSGGTFSLRFSTTISSSATGWFDESCTLYGTPRAVCDRSLRFYDTDATVYTGVVHSTTVTLSGTDLTSQPLTITAYANRLSGTTSGYCSYTNRYSSSSSSYSYRSGSSGSGSGSSGSHYSRRKRLRAGGIAGIAVGAFVVITGLVSTMLWLRARTSRQRQAREASPAQATELEAADTRNPETEMASKVPEVRADTVPPKFG